MKMPNGGFNPACNVQLATDTESRAIVGVEVSKEGSDSAGLSAPMREQVEQRSGGRWSSICWTAAICARTTSSRRTSRAWNCSCRPSRQEICAERGRELEPKPGDSEAVQAWKRRMASAEGKEIYQQRAATSETVNADLRSYRGLTQSRCADWPRSGAWRCGARWRTT